MIISLILYIYITCRSIFRISDPQFGKIFSTTTTSKTSLQLKN